MTTLVKIFLKLFGTSSAKESDWSILPVATPDPIAGYWDQMDMPPEEIALLFKVKSWIYDSANGSVIPDAEIIGERIRYLVSLIEESDSPGVWANFGRLMVVQDPETPSYYSVMLELGLVPKKGD